MSRQELEALMAKAEGWPVSAEAQEAQRRSFAYGNTRFENEDITRATVDAAAESLITDAKD